MGRKIFLNRIYFNEELCSRVPQFAIRLGRHVFQSFGFLWHTQNVNIYKEWEGGKNKTLSKFNFMGRGLLVDLFLITQIGVLNYVFNFRPFCSNTCFQFEVRPGSFWTIEFMIGWLFAQSDFLQKHFYLRQSTLVYNCLSGNNKCAEWTRICKYLTQPWWAIWIVSHQESYDSTWPMIPSWLIVCQYISLFGWIFGLLVGSARGVRWKERLCDTVTDKVCFKFCTMGNSYIKYSRS